MSDDISDAVAEAIRIMEVKYHEPINIEDLAEYLHYSKFHFTRQFTRLAGMTPRRYLAIVRMRRAMGYLRNSPHSVASVSHLVGYSSVGTFSSRFREMVGLSPSEWRRDALRASVPKGRRERVPAHDLDDLSPLASSFS